MMDNHVNTLPFFDILDDEFYDIIIPESVCNTAIPESDLHCNLKDQYIGFPYRRE